MSMLQSEREQAQLHYQQQTQGLVDLLFDCLELILRLDQALHRLQPIHSGRIRVMWFAPEPSKRSYPGERKPQMVKWSRHIRTGKWRALRIPLHKLLKYQCRTRAFQAHYKQAQAILCALRDLLHMRSLIKKHLLPAPQMATHWLHRSTQEIQALQSVLDAPSAEAPPLSPQNGLAKLAL